MIKNLGNVDRGIRIALGLGILSLVFVGPQTHFGLLGLVLIATSAISFCPFYHLFGIRTCKS